MPTTLINPRGRKITVEDHQVQNLLQNGFLYPPKDGVGPYNPIFDRGPEAARDILIGVDSSGKTVSSRPPVGSQLIAEDV